MRIARMSVVLLLLAVVVAGATWGASAQTTHQVDLLIEEVEGRPVPEFFFEPVGLYIEPGDTVVFVARTPHHTVTAYHALQGKVQRVPEAAEPFSSPMIPVGSTWEYTFTVPGVYDVWCGPHESYGMVMRIVVGEASGPGNSLVTDFSSMGAMGTAGTVLNDPALNPARIIQVGSVAWAEISPESKAISSP